MKNFVIGTAGHVDHGKTTLVKALTGIDTDRLKEEKERGISIELGFAQMRLPGGSMAGLVDVPGHEKFIKNMLAGVGGIDMFMLVVAADEGVMPQTREHLEIIKLLQIEKGVAVLTKVDMVDAEWLAMVREDVLQYLEQTADVSVPLVEVSAVTGQGLKELLGVIEEISHSVKERSAMGPPRLPVDRVFTITGFGTVVTGTLVSGTLALGSTVEVVPAGLSARVRSLQVHGHKVEEARAGQRVAVNLTGLEVEEVPRGSVVALPGQMQPSYRMDINLSLLKSAKVLKHRSRVRLYLGTAEILGRVLLLDREEMQPGEQCYASMELEEPAVAVKGDIFVIRSYSPMETIGGGKVIDPVSSKHRRMRVEVIDTLETLERGSPEELIEQYSRSAGLMGAEEFVKVTGLVKEDVAQALYNLVQKNSLVEIAAEDSIYYVQYAKYQSWLQDVSSMLGDYHRQYPLREGFPREELRSRKFSLLTPKQYQAILQRMEADGIIKPGAATVALKDFVCGPDEKGRGVLASIERAYLTSGFQPPTWADAAKKERLPEEQSQEMLKYLLNTGILVKLSDDIFFHRQVLNEARLSIVEFLKNKVEITVGEVRDLLTTSRKYALPLMEYFDKIKVTRRVGDKRLLGRSAEKP